MMNGAITCVKKMLSPWHSKSQGEPPQKDPSLENMKPIGNRVSITAFVATRSYLTQAQSLMPVAVGLLFTKPQNQQPSLTK
jgi:hypothetical protein